MAASTTANLTITFTLELRDLYRANIAILSANLRKLKIVLVLILFFALAGELLVLLHRNDADRLSAPLQTMWTILIALAALVAYICYGVSYIKARSLYKNGPGVKSPIRYEFSDSGVITETTVGRSDRRWAAFTKVGESRDFFLLYVQNGIAHPIPKRAFDGENQIREFRALVKRQV
jgi:hypothetical protein